MTCAACGAAVSSRFCPSCGARQPDAGAVAVAIDATPFADFRVGEQCLLRLQVRNDGAAPLDEVALALDPGGALRTGPLAPGAAQVVHALFRPAVAGQHALRGAVTVAPGGARLAMEPVLFRIAAASALQQQIHIDARENRVGIFENIGVAERGGLVGGPDWRPIALGPAPAEPLPAAGLPIGRRGVGRVVAVGTEIQVALDGVTGALVELSDPQLRQVLRVHDQLEVAVLGHDAAGRPLLTDRVAAEVRHQQVEVGPGEDLGAALAALAPGGTVILRGAHHGPWAIERPVQIIGHGAVLEAARGPVLRVRADCVLQGLEIRGAAPAGAYAVDALEIAAGRVVVQDCTLSSDAPGNLVPGRAVAVVGPAQVELRGVTLRHAGLAVAVDVSWSGFPGDDARGARVLVTGGRIDGVGVGVAAAGEGREVRLTEVAFGAVADQAVRVLRGAHVTAERCRVDPAKMTAESGSHLVVQGCTP